MLTWHRRRALAGLLFVLPTWLAWVFWTLGPAVSTLGMFNSKDSKGTSNAVVGIQSATRARKDRKTEPPRSTSSS